LTSYIHAPNNSGGAITFTPNGAATGPLDEFALAMSAEYPSQTSASFLVTGLTPNAATGFQLWIHNSGTGSAQFWNKRFFIQPIP
jgi:hypothetical protein